LERIVRERREQDKNMKGIKERKEVVWEKGGKKIKI
jgi:hypothetical protein